MGDGRRESCLERSSFGCFISSVLPRCSTTYASHTTDKPHANDYGRFAAPRAGRQYVGIWKDHKKETKARDPNQIHKKIKNINTRNHGVVTFLNTCLYDDFPSQLPDRLPTGDVHSFVVIFQTCNDPQQCMSSNSSISGLVVTRLRTLRPTKLRDARARLPGGRRISFMEETVPLLRSRKAPLRVQSTCKQDGNHLKLRRWRDRVSVLL